MNLTIKIPDDEAAVITALQEKLSKTFHKGVSPSWVVRDAIGIAARVHKVEYDPEFSDRLVREGGRGGDLPPHRQQERTTH